MRNELEALKRSVVDQQNHCCCSLIEFQQEDRVGQRYPKQLVANGTWCVLDALQLADWGEKTDYAPAKCVHAFEDQVLWQVAYIAETIWDAIYTPQHGEQDGNSSTTSPLIIQTLSNVKLAVLEQLQTLVPNNERHLFEELHALYTEVAHHEKLQESLAHQIQTLLLENEELERRTPDLEDRLAARESEAYECALVSQRAQEDVTECKLTLDKVRELQQRLDERDYQIKQLLNMVETQAAVILAEPPGASRNDGDSSDLLELCCTSELVPGNPDYDEYDEFEAPVDDFLNQTTSSFDEIHSAFHGCESREIITSCKEKSSQEDACESELNEAIGILQAQLEMYIRCFQKKHQSKR